MEWAEAASSRRSSEKAAGKAKNIDELVIVLARLVRSDESELRALIGAVHGTWTTPLQSTTAQYMLDENQAFNAQAQQERDKKKEAKKEGKEHAHG